MFYTKIWPFGKENALKKNTFYITAIFLLFFSLGLPQVSFTQVKQEAQKDAKQPQKQESSIQKDVFSKIAGISAQNLSTLTISDSTINNEDLIYAREYGAETLDTAIYGDFTVEIFSTKYPNQAYGFYTIFRDPLASPTDFGTEGDLDVVERRINFWQGTRYVKIKSEKATANIQTMIKLGEGISEKILALDKKTMVDPDIELAKKLPSVIRNLPKGSLNLRTATYILGPEGLKSVLKKDVSHYDFYPNLGTEIAYASFEQENGKVSFLIIEHHTPQQSIAAFNKLTDYKNSLPEEEKNKILLKREGNYIIEASDSGTSQSAKNLVDDVKYNYVVKWLNDNTPSDNNGRTVASEAAKTAKILVSVFGLIGVGMIFAVIGGVSLGFLVFYLRRRNKLAVESYSDAGGMMRLNLDGISIRILPKTQDGKNLIGDGN